MAIAAVLGAVLMPLPDVLEPSVAAAAPDEVIAIVIEGTGFGHGRGLSQWGAYGYAVDHGWDWQQILDHYYGGTDSGTTAANQRVSVDLVAHRDRSTVGVVSSAGGVKYGSATAPAMRATYVGANQFLIERSSQRSCASTAALVVPDAVGLGSNDSTAVRQVQRFLNDFQQPVVVDGSYGAQTAGALDAWQNARGLPRNGSVWDGDDAATARNQLGSSGSPAWTSVATHTQTPDNPVRFTTDGGDSASTASRDVLGLCSSGGSISHYRGAIEVVRGNSGNRVVNDVLAEQYVRGVIPKEISASWADAGNGAGANAVRAQAVAARSYGLSENRSYFFPNSSTQYASTCDTTSCQVYAGADAEDPRTDAAVAATQHVVRKWPNGHALAGRLVRTEFSASNGPRTAGGAFPPVDDIGDDTTRNPNHRWTRIIDAHEFAARHGLGTITAATMAPTASSQYRGFDGIWFDDVVITGTNGTFRQQAWDFRNANDLRSPGFTLRVIRRNEQRSSMGFIGDSVGRGITLGNSEYTRITDGTFPRQTIDAVDSRCTTRSSCPGTSGVEAAGALPTGLDLVVVELGYNDNPATFGSDIDAMMRALDARGAARVVWVNLAERRASTDYARSNRALDAAADRWGNLSVLDWRAATRTAEASRWFNSDGVHLTTTGEAEFALWLRSQIVGIEPDHYLSPPERIELSVAGLRSDGADDTGLTLEADISAVSVNITMADSSGVGYGTVWPCGVDRPFVSNANVTAGATVANSVIAPVSPQGTVCFYSSVGTDFIVDLAGWFRAGESETFVAMSPKRHVDTRTGIGGRTTPLSPDKPYVFRAAGLAGTRADGTPDAVPTDALAVALNVTADASRGNGYITVWPCSSDRPLASNVNLDPGSAVGNGVIAPLGDDGTVCLYSNTRTELIVDLAGYFPDTGADTPSFVPAVPRRVVDSRNGTGAPQRRVTPDSPLRLPIAGQKFTSSNGSEITVADDVVAAVMNLTVVVPSSVGYATVWPCGTKMPVASNVNVVAGQDRANSVIAPVGADGAVCVFVNAPADIVVDISGWFLGDDTDGFVGVVPRRLVDTRFGVGPIPA